ncbi:MAG: threonine synthase [Candidatus Ratteibacteria bacterium]
MDFIRGLKCRECGREYPEEPIYVCEWCFGSLEVIYDYEEIKKTIKREIIEKRNKNLWRYIELLPLRENPKAGLNTGFTPFFRARNLEKKLKAKEIYIKDDSVNHPTLSFKDRVVSVAVSKAIEFGFDTVACASTGNLANSVASIGALCNLKRFIFIPADLEKGKIIGSSVYNPIVIGVEGNYDQVNRLCTEIASKYKWAFVNINIRPYYSEGSKTYGFEIIEQFGWKTPKHIVVPCAGGSLITKIWKGIKEFYKIGFIENIDTKLYAAQPEGCSPIVKAIKENTEIIKPVKPNTIVKSLAIGNPADGVYAVRSVKESGGYGEEVSDEEVIEGIRILAETEGIFTETAGGVTVAVTKKLLEKGIIPPDESIVISITGNGLKTTEPLYDKISQVIKIKPNLEAFEEKLKKLGG